MSVIEAPQGQEQKQTAAVEADARRMWRWSTYVHVGVGADGVLAEELPDNGAGDEDYGRFHAFVRLPNPFQHREIREKALAAQARKARLMRDPESDAYAVIDAEMGELLAAAQAGERDAIVDEIVGRSWASDYMAAMSELREDENYEHVDHDRERLAELEAKPEDERPTDEYESLTRHLTAYAEALDAKVNETQAPQREALADRAPEDLIEVLRAQRIEVDAEEEYLHVYGAWEIVAGTFVPDASGNPRSYKRHFQSADDLASQPEEVIETLRVALDDLRVAQQRAVTGGNS